MPEHPFAYPTTCTFDIGARTSFGEGIVFGPNCRRVKIGFGCYLGRDIYVDVEELEIGDYTRIHHGSVIHGVRTRIGHNCWIGHYTVIDSLGGNTVLGNGVGVGAHSQLWSHMKFGDTLAGCRWRSSGPLVLEDDVWLVGHSIVGPIHAEPKSMLMTGGVAVQDMKANQIYAGSPAKSITNKLGLQFDEPTLSERQAGFAELRKQFTESTGQSAAQFVDVEAFEARADVTQFDLMKRTYLPRYTDDEYAFMRFLLYDKAKFVPVSLDSHSEAQA